MNTALFMVGDISITPVGAIAAAVLISMVGLIVALRSSARRVQLQAEQAAAQLKANFVAQLAERDSRIHQLDRQVHQERERGADLLDAERDRCAQLLAEVSALRARMAEQTKQSEVNLTRFLDARQQMSDEFKAIAGDVLRSHGETFSRQNREQVDVLLKPLQEKIGEFHSGLLRDRAAMSEQIRALAESNLQITTEANNLTRALKGNAQTQGAWGEMILSTILERSGLREGDQFTTQTSHTSDEGARLRTDVEILMPNQDRLVIDSKVSLTAFAAFTGSEPPERDLHLQAHITSVRNHIRTLGDKAYHRHAGSKLDYVMMFVPIEAALSIAIQADPELVEFSMSRGVMLTTPTTLMTVLRTVRNIWDIEKRHQNADEIAARAGNLYDKVVGFLASMDKIGAHIDKAQQSYSEAKGQLSEGKGSVVRQVLVLRELGAKASKQIPGGWDSIVEEPLLLVSEDNEPVSLA